MVHVVGEEVEEAIKVLRAGECRNAEHVNAEHVSAERRRLVAYGDKKDKRKKVAKTAKARAKSRKSHAKIADMSRSC